jgi:hypothetical protein
MRLPGWYPAATMPDLSFRPIGDAAAVAALLWTVWHERSQEKVFGRSNPEHGSSSEHGSKKVLSYPKFG